MLTLAANQSSVLGRRNPGKGGHVNVEPIGIVVSPERQDGVGDLVGDRLEQIPSWRRRHPDHSSTCGPGPAQPASFASEPECGLADEPLVLVEGVSEDDRTSRPVAEVASGSAGQLLDVVKVAGDVLEGEHPARRGSGAPSGMFEGEMDVAVGVHGMVETDAAHDADPGCCRWVVAAGTDHGHVSPAWRSRERWPAGHLRSASMSVPHGQPRISASASTAFMPRLGSRRLP